MWLKGAEGRLIKFSQSASSVCIRTCLRYSMSWWGVLWETGSLQECFVAVLKDIVLIPVHTTPWDSEKELDELYEVFLIVKDKWKTDVSCTLDLQWHTPLFYILISEELCNLEMVICWNMATFDAISLYSYIATKGKKNLY